MRNPKVRILFLTPLEKGVFFGILCTERDNRELRDVFGLNGQMVDQNLSII